MNPYIFLQRSEFQTAYTESKHYYFGCVLPDVPTWDEVFVNLECSVLDDVYIKNLPQYGIVTHAGERYMPKVKAFQDAIAKEFNYDKVSSHVYIALTKMFQSFGDHKDVSDVLFWQIIGETTWVVTDRGVKHQYKLTPGDVIYVPQQMYHQVISNTPRVGISIGMDY